MQIHRRVDVMYNNDNPDLPTLNPWVLTTPPPAQRFVFERNPYYYRIDEKGQQLPYVDRVMFTVAAPNLIPAKAGLGEADLQPRYLNMRDYTFLQKSAKHSGVEVRLWEEGSGSQLALYPNLNAKDEAWRRLFRDVRFRRALSLGDRPRRAQPGDLSSGSPSRRTTPIMPRSALFKPEYATKWATYDPKQANKLLDEIGLDQAQRCTASACCPTAGRHHRGRASRARTTEDTDALQLIADHWKKIGIKMLFKPQSPENFRLRAFSGEAIMTAYAGVTTAVPTADTSPKEFAPDHAGRPAMARAGACTSRPRASRARSATCRKPASFSTRSRSGRRDRRGRPPRGVGEDPARSTPSRCSPSAP